MLEYPDIHNRLQDRNISKVSKETGISRPTLIRIRDSQDPGNVSYATIEVLSEYFEKQEGNDHVG